MVTKLNFGTLSADRLLQLPTFTISNNQLTIIHYNDLGLRALNRPPLVRASRSCPTSFLLIVAATFPLLTACDLEP